MKLLRDRRSRSLLALIVIGLLLGITGGTVAAFSDTAANGSNSFGVEADYEPPTVSKAVIAKINPSTLYLDSAIRQNQAFYIYASVTDGGNPAVGISTVTADASNVSAASMPVTLTAGPCPCSVQGSTYDYRSASLTSRNPLSGDQAWSVTATDALSQSATFNSSGAGPVYTVNLDTTVPAPVVASTTATNFGATAGRLESSDTITYAWNDRIDPESIKANWDGTETIAVGVVVTNSGSNDTVRINVTGGTANVFGSWNLNANYVTSSSTPTGTLALSSDYQTVTVTLTANPTGQRTIASSTPVWTRTTTINDDAGNTMTAGNTTLNNATYF